MSKPHDPQGPLDVAPDPDLLRRVLDNQANDILTRQREQDLREREINNAHEYALRLLDAQLADRQREREHQKQTNTNGCLFGSFLFLLFAAAICYTLYLNKDQLVLEFLKAALFLLTGGLGGYSFKVVKDRNDAPKQ
jgi:hypothetical protein